MVWSEARTHAAVKVYACAARRGLAVVATSNTIGR
jgi:hypothetical protein